MPLVNRNSATTPTAIYVVLVLVDPAKIQIIHILSFRAIPTSGGDFIYKADNINMDSKIHWTIPVAFTIKRRVCVCMCVFIVYRFFSGRNLHLKVLQFNIILMLILWRFNWCKIHLKHNNRLAGRKKKCYARNASRCNAQHGAQLQTSLTNLTPTDQLCR